MAFRKFELKNRNNKLLYYIRAIVKTQLVPTFLLRRQLKKKLSFEKRTDKDYIKKRVNYYNKLSTSSVLKADAVALSDVKLPKRQRVYYFDSQEFLRFFDRSLRISFLWGDVRVVPDGPAFVKSRPLNVDNSNSVILKLNKARHFTFSNDTKSFDEKRDMLIGRAFVNQPHRIRFYEMYFNHPMCDLGQINSNINPQWIKDRITISAHLNYKFVLALEGNDVATNLKWIMSSNSLAVMPTPRFETWFMEGSLIPDYHYVHIKDDFSNLEEKLNYYIQHPEKAIQIAENANAYINQFKDKNREDLISLLVIEKYFYRTGQLTPVDPLLFE